MRTQLPSPKRGGRQPPIFGPFLLWPKGWLHQDVSCYGGRSRLRPHCARCINATWYGGRPRPRRHCVRCGPSSPPQQRGTAPKFSAHVYCGQTAVSIRIRLGTEVGLSLGDIVLDGDPAAPPLKGHSPQFSAHVRCGQTAGWTEMPLCMEVDLDPGDFVFNGDPALPRKKAQPPPNFWPMSIVDKRLDG